MARVAHESLDVIDAWAAAFNAGDVDGLTDLYEDGAVLAGLGADEPVIGIGPILAAWRPLLGATVTVLARRALVNGDVALTQNRCRFEMAGGEPIVSSTVEVVRRQADGSWRYVLCNPHGEAVLG